MKEKVKVLLVDDERSILDGLSRGLRGLYDLRMATSGAEGIAILEREPDLAVVMSDMRMPAMNGAAFLAKAKELVPDATRLLLTGQADMEDAIAAINEGSIFRFMKKPCAPDVMRATLAAAAEQHRLVTAERLLLQQTLRGAVQALCDTLALASPEVFGFSMRVRRLASEIALELGETETWPIEVAAMLYHLGAMTLPAHVWRRHAGGEQLVGTEREMLDRAPAITDKLLAPIPRLEPVRDIITQSRSSFTDVHRTVTRTGLDLPLGATILRVAMDFEELVTATIPPIEAIHRLRARHVYDPRVVDVLERRNGASPKTEVSLAIAALRPGMVIARDIVTQTGMLLVSRGHEVTEGLIGRLENFGAMLVDEKVNVVADADLHPLRGAAAA